MSPAVNNRRIGVFDVGSNSVRLLVAEKRGEQVFSVRKERITTRLLAGFAEGSLSPEAIGRTAKAIAQLAEIARQEGAEDLIGFGTSAMRDGENRDELIRLADRAGVRLRVLSGEEEADLAYAGAGGTGRFGVLDIGGGSTELLCGADGRVCASGSAQIGAVRLFEAAGPAADARTLIGMARSALLPVWERVRVSPADRWVGTGGTVTTLAAMRLGLSVYDPERIQNTPVTASGTRETLDGLLSMDLEARRRIPGLNPERADIIPCGAAILLAFFGLSGADAVYASDRDNLLGYAGKYFSM